MSRAAKIKTLTHQEEIELLRQAKQGKTRREREAAIRLLIHYNQSFVKYLVGGYYYFQNEIDPEDLVAEGKIGLLRAIEEYDLSRAEKYRLASFAGHYVRQKIRTFIKNCQLFPQTAIPKGSRFFEEEEEEENNLSEAKRKSPQKKSWGIIYYDKNHLGTEKDDKTTSLLLDTLTTDGIEQQIEQQVYYEEIKIKVNKLISQLEYHEELIIRLFFGIVPANLEQISRWAAKEKLKELKKIKIKKKSTLFDEEKIHPLLEKYHEILTVLHKKEEIIQKFMQPDFWEYFREFPELALKTKPSRKNNVKKSAEMKENINPTEWEKWKKKSIPEEQILRWNSLGYQPEDIADPQNQVLQKLGISKKEKEQWKKAGSKTKSKNWLETRLAKAVDNRKKLLLEKLKQIQWKE